MNKLVIILLLIAIANTSYAQVSMRLIGRCPTTACASDPVVCTVRIQNRDNNVWAVTAMRAIFHHVSGDTGGANLLSAPVLLPVFGAALDTPAIDAVQLSDAGHVLLVDLTGQATEMTTSAPFTARATVLIDVANCP